jgi:outer membrane lipoprotein SlyB
MAAVAAITLAGCGQAQQTAENVADDSASETARHEARPIQVQQARPSVTTVRLPAGTQFEIKLKQTLDSGENQAGDQFAAKVIHDVKLNGRTVIPAGSMVRGEVKDVKAAKRGAGQASMTLAFNMLILPDNSSAPMVASISQSSESKKKRNAGIIGGAAAGGALLGKIIGKDTKGAVVGAVVGGAIGTGVVMSKDGEQVKIPRGTEFMIRLDENLKISRRS